MPRSTKHAYGAFLSQIRPFGPYRFDQNFGGAHRPKPQAKPRVKTHAQFTINTQSQAQAPSSILLSPHRLYVMGMGAYKVGKLLDPDACGISPMNKMK